MSGCNKLAIFPGKPFQPSLMFLSLSTWEVLYLGRLPSKFTGETLGGTKISYLVLKTFLGRNYAAYYATVVTYNRKLFIRLAPTENVLK